MSKEYDVKEVDAYIEHVMLRKPLQRVAVWLSLNGGTSDRASWTLYNRFCRQSLAVQANILYRFEDILKEAALEAARAKAAEARKTGDM